MPQPAIISGPTLDARRRMSIGFLNWAHALDHYVMLIFPTVVISLALVEGRSYADLIALGTGDAGWWHWGVLAASGAVAQRTRWSRRNL